MGDLLNADEKLLLSELPKATEGLLGRIPRLENVAAIAAYATRPQVAKIPAPVEVTASAAVLMRIDALTSAGKSAETAIATLRAR